MNELERKRMERLFQVIERPAGGHQRGGWAVTSKQLSGRGFIDKTVRQVGRRKKLILHSYHDNGRIVGEKLFLSEQGVGGIEYHTFFFSTAEAARALEVAEDSEPGWALPHRAQTVTRPRRQSW